MNSEVNGRLIAAPLSLVLSVCIAGEAGATLIDDWVAQQTESTPPNMVQGAVSGPGILGGTRTAIIDTIGQDVETMLDIGVQESGNLSFNVGEGATEPAILEILWAGADPNVGLGGVDITDGGVAQAFRVQIRAESNDLMKFTLNVTDAMDNVGGMLLPIFAGSTDDTYFLRFSGFIGMGDEPVLVNMTEVEYIHIAVAAPAGSEVHVGPISTVVPEPPPAALFTLAFLALITVSTRRPRSAR